MSLYLSDQEQLHLIRDWFKKHSKLLALSLTVFLVVFFGLHAWQNYKTIQTENTSILYERLLVNVQEHKKIDYPLKQKNTAYGQLMTLLHAREAIEKNDFDTAANDLRWIINHTQNSSLKQISRIRLARILFAQNKPNLALKQIETIDDSAFSPLISKMKAAILFAQ